jgi:hypothetical protein
VAAVSEPLLYWATGVAGVGLSLLALMPLVVAARGVGSGHSLRRAVLDSWPSNQANDGQACNRSVHRPPD